MAITAVDSATSDIIKDLMEKYNHPEEKVEPTDTLGKDDFMKLLIVELKNQDPLNPMDNKEMISQQAQFTSLEQMQNLNTNFENFMKNMNADSRSNAVSFIDKEVTITDPETLDQITGNVDEVHFRDGEAFLLIHGAEVPMDMVTAVRDANTTAQNVAE